MFVVALFFGLKAAVLAIVLEAVVRIGKRALKNNVMLMLAGVVTGTIPAAASAATCQSWSGLQPPSPGADGNELEILGAGRYQQDTLLRISNAIPAAGRLYALSAADVFLKEVSGSLDVLRVESTGGSVRLSVLDTPGAITGTTTPLPEDLTLLAGGGRTLTGAAVAGGVVQALSGG